MRKLVENYQPNTRVLKIMGRIRVVAIVGPSASGKTTLMNFLTKNDSEFGFILDETSRAPRSGEKQGTDYLFRSPKEIIEDARRGNLVQIAIGPNGDLYCTRLDSYPMGHIGLIALVPAAVEEFRRLPVASFKAFFTVPPSYEVWEERLTKQAADSNWSAEKMQERLIEAKASFEFALSDKDVHFILNDEVEQAAKHLKHLLNNQINTEREEKARKIAESLRSKLI